MKKVFLVMALGSFTLFTTSCLKKEQGCYTQNGGLLYTEEQHKAEAAENGNQYGFVEQCEALGGKVQEID
ncbi:hypothetical protein [Brumimicrobium sp.]|uniref:hypothetical protein n=1 Tax=Brumimicrobium sp. TaxID=2029867 RepID=UPI00260D27C1|nr:hypothetical protein [uncultured Brumimicrobium sp.]